MKDAVYKLLGRTTAWIDGRFEVAFHGRETVEHRKGGSATDRTGLLVRPGERLTALMRESDLLYFGYESAAQSLWRAQEFSLFHRNRALLTAPLLDFGCGDGSFAAALFDSVDYGVDVDPAALERARAYGLYRDLLQSAEVSIPLPDSAVGSIVSNSVLEHVTRLDDVLKELRRILRKDGRLVFSVPVIAFRRQLAKWFGEAESIKVNVQYYHRNLFSPGEWRARLEAAGFEIEELRPFQPEKFTFWYRMFRLFGRKGLGRLIPDPAAKLWRVCRRGLVRMVRQSIERTTEGANIFVIARAK